MITPPYLKPGDEVRLIAASRWVEKGLVEKMEAVIRGRGFKSTRSVHLLERDCQFAGTDSQRASDFISAWEDPHVRAIWSMRGGYGAQRMLEQLNDLDLQYSPKWLVGFSDMTAIHCLLTNAGISSIHGPLGSTISTTEGTDVEACFNALMNPLASVEFSSSYENVVGQGQGILVGGNLSVLHTMINTPSFPELQGALLFIEDIDEMLYHLDRIMNHLVRSGELGKVNGLIVGGFTDMRDNTRAFGFSADNPFGMDSYEIIRSYTKDLNIPVAFGFPSGHGDRNHPLILGADVSIEVGRSGGALNYLS